MGFFFIFETYLHYLFSGIAIADMTYEDLF